LFCNSDKVRNRFRWLQQLNGQSIGGDLESAFDVTTILYLIAAFLCIKPRFARRQGSSFRKSEGAGYQALGSYGKKLLDQQHLVAQQR